ncbi:MAG: hypothetical protein KKE93_00480 [Nanoarchaeota archaeon]|nr:hypothetical protein [Nanoarchaeota archaeon]
MNKIKLIEKVKNIPSGVKNKARGAYDFGCKAAFVLPVSALTYFGFEKGRDIANSFQYSLLQHYEGSTNLYSKIIEYVLEKPYLSDLALIGASTALVFGSAKIADKYNPVKKGINGLRDLGSACFEGISHISGWISNFIRTEEYGKNTLEKEVEENYSPAE